MERASYRRPGFVLDSENAPSVAEVCRRLDGIPLAIELAAARVGTLSVAQIADRLGHSLKLLSGKNRSVPERQRTLRAALNWSYELLDEAERELFGRLSVFAGGFALDAAGAVGGRTGETEVLDLLSRLVDKSLVLVTDRNVEARYRLLEPVSQYAREKLRGSGEEPQALMRHAEYYLALAEEAEPNLMGPEQEAWLGRLEREHDNLRAALRRSLEGGGDEEFLSLGLASALWSFWYTHGHMNEGRRWLESVISKHGPTTTSVKAKALNGAGYITLFQGDYEAAKGFLEASLVLYRGLSDKEGIASSLV